MRAELCSKPMSARADKFESVREHPCIIDIIPGSRGEPGDVAKRLRDLSYPASRGNVTPIAHANATALAIAATKGCRVLRYTQRLNNP